MDMIPLYEILEKKVDLKYKNMDEGDPEMISLIQNKWKAATSIISMLDPKKSDSEEVNPSDIIFLLILHNYTMTCNKNPKKIPHNGKIMESNLLYTAKPFPIKLQLIILEYLDQLCGK